MFFCFSKSDERKKVEKKIIRWLTAEVNQGIAGSLETMMEEFRQRVTQQKNEEYESKRYLFASIMYDSILI